MKMRDQQLQRIASALERIAAGIECLRPSANAVKRELEKQQEKTLGQVLETLNQPKRTEYCSCHVPLLNSYSEKCDRCCRPVNFLI